MNVEFQRAKPDQAIVLTEIAFAAKRHWGYPEGWIEIWSPILTVSPEFIEKNNTYIVYVDGKPAGFYAISLDDKKANLEHLWVRPKYMGQGIGRALFKHALTQCRKIGVAILEIESDPNAQGFYERMGAKNVGQTAGEVDGQVRILPVLEIKLTQ